MDSLEKEQRYQVNQRLSLQTYFFLIFHRTLWSIEHITGELDFHIAYESMYEESFRMKASDEN